MTTRLVAFTVVALDAEANSAATLCSILGVARPIDWPPPFSDDGVRNWFRDRLQAEPDLAPWLGYYVVSSFDGRDTLVGTAGYKGPPDASGTVEIGFSIVPAYQRKGIGTALVASLLKSAFADVRVHRVTAETPLDLVASRGLLEKCGFRQVGQRVDPVDGELALYEVSRSQ